MKSRFLFPPVFQMSAVTASRRVRPTKIDRRARLVSAIACGQRWCDEIAAGDFTDVQQITRPREVQCLPRQYDGLKYDGLTDVPGVRVGPRQYRRLPCRMASESSACAMPRRSGNSSSKPLDSLPSRLPRPPRPVAPCAHRSSGGAWRGIGLSLITYRPMTCARARSENLYLGDGGQCQEAKQHCVLRRSRKHCGGQQGCWMVGATGIEPVTPTMST